MKKIFAFPLLLCPLIAVAEEHALPHAFSLLWALPFVGILLSIALFPLFLPSFWHNHFGKVSAFWAFTFFIPAFFSMDVQSLTALFSHVLLGEYIPFIVLLLALFTITNGIRIEGTWNGTPFSNLSLLLFGGLIASFIGTTGASMLLIHPLLKANAWRKEKAHLVIFFIFIVSNIGGALTPLGDPPLFLGFLNGIDFFWTTAHLFVPFSIVMVLLLIVFFGVDSFFYKKEKKPFEANSKANNRKLQISGEINILILFGVLGAVLMSGFWKSNIMVSLGVDEVPLENLLRDLLLILLTFLSFVSSKKRDLIANDFSWAPMLEVAKIFFTIFITVAPVIHMLKAGLEGPFASLISLTTCDNEPQNAVYFWLCGILSSFLDNAPTYLVFFNMAGGNATTLMGPCSATLVAISCGAVFMGAMTYIGNAPNFMVRSIAEQRGVPMPGFFGFMAWSSAILVPIFILLTMLHFL